MSDSSHPVRSGCALHFHIITNCIGVAGGIIGFFVFAFQYYNYHAGLWSLLSAVFATLCLHLNVFFKYRQLETWHSLKSLSVIYYLAFGGITAGVIAMLAYIGLSVHNHIPMLPVETSLLLPAVQAFLTVKWSIVLVFAARKYSRHLQQEYTLM